MTEPIGNPRSSGYAKIVDEWYVEPVSATTSLLAAEPFIGGVWDPACGQGNVIFACRRVGKYAIGTDIVQRGAASVVADFLESDTLPATNIITNPPFSQAANFALHALSLVVGGKVAILQRTTWLEGEKRYQSLFRHGQLKSIWQFRRRISMPPGGKDIPATNGSIAYAWFVFSNAHAGPPTLGWI